MPESLCSFTSAAHSGRHLSLPSMLYFFIEVYLIYSVVLTSGVQQMIQLYMCVYIFFSIIVYYKILHIVPCAVQ